MIVDSLAMVAILNQELDAACYGMAIASNPTCRMAIANTVAARSVTGERLDPA